VGPDASWVVIACAPPAAVVVPGGDAAASGGGGEDDADEDGGECAGVEEEDDPIIYSISLSNIYGYIFESCTILALIDFPARGARRAARPPFFCVGRRPRRAGRQRDKEKHTKEIKGTINKKNPPNRSVGEIIPTTHDRMTIPGSESV
jgi:hypothetical protein